MHRLYHFSFWFRKFLLGDCFFFGWTKRKRKVRTPGNQGTG